MSAECPSSDRRTGWLQSAVALLVAVSVIVEVPVAEARADAIRRPDLRVAAVSDPPQTAAPGQRFKIVVRIRNAAPRVARRSRAALFLVGAHGSRAGGPRLAATRATPALAGGKSMRRSGRLAVPETARPGALRVLACADVHHLVREANERNNCRLSSRRVRITSGDRRGSDPITSGDRRGSDPITAGDGRDLDPIAAGDVPGRLYWGAWIGKQLTGTEAPWDWNAVSEFERRNAGGKRLSVLQWSSPFSASTCGGSCRFDTGLFESVRARGVIPFFSWGSSGIRDADLAAGSHDDYIREWATAAREWGHPFFLRFNWEMNGSWFPWGVGNQGTTAADYVASWRRVHDIFRSVGATNATWVWCPNVDPPRGLADLTSVYPGDAYVDWTCLDGYSGDVPARSFEDLFGRTYDEVTASIAPAKPMIVGEVGASEAGGGKAAWLRAMFDALPTRFPKVRGLIWFDKEEIGPGNRVDWPLESSAEAAAAFARGVAAATFAGAADGAPIGLPISPPS